MTKDGFIGLHECRQRQRICRRAHGDQQRGRFGHIKGASNALGDFVHRRVVAVGHGRAGVGRKHRFHDLWGDRTRVVRGEVEVHGGYSSCWGGASWPKGSSIR